MFSKVLALVAVGMLVGSVALAATTYKSKSSFTLQSGSYCYQETHGLVGNKFTVNMTLTSGACTGSGETIIVP